MVLTVSFVLSPAIGLFCHRRPALASHAQHCRVHRISSRVRDDRDTPLVWDETAAVIEVIWVGAEQQNFLLWDSTAPITPDLARRAVDFFTRRHSSSRWETKFDPSGKSPATASSQQVSAWTHATGGCHSICEGPGYRFAHPGYACCHRPRRRTIQ